MTRLTIPWRAGALALSGLLVFAAGCGVAAEPDDSPEPTVAPPVGTADAFGSLYGRVTTYDGDTYKGPLRWGNGEEAFWDHTFNGTKDVNPWAALTPVARLAEERRPVTVLGFRLPWDEPRVDLRRPFMARFGDIARIESRGDGMRGVLRDGARFDPQVRVTLKSGTAFDLDRLAASDFDDGVRMWDEARGVVDLAASEIRTIDLFAPDAPNDAADRLYGTVRTPQGDFTGFLQWDREEALGRDELVGSTAGGQRRLRFDAIRSIARSAGGGGVLVTTLDGPEIALSGTRQLGPTNRGIYVEDVRFGRVLVSWDAFERVDFRRGGPGPSYDDFSPGRPLAGRVTTRDGRRLAGRLVYDLDERETTETLDAPFGGVDYTIPFGDVASIAFPELDGETEHVTVTLVGGESLRLEPGGDLGGGDAGMLVLTDDPEHPEFVPWPDVARVDFDAEPAAPER